MSLVQGILTDTTRCVGCEACVEACREENGLGPDVPRRWKRRIDDLSSTRYTTLVRRPGNRFVRQQCRHCLKPACVSACLVGALQKTEQGPVIYDNDRCMGCRYCMLSCPYGIPRYDWEAAVPFVRKCTLCATRLSAGREPACTEACPEQATIFGPRDELLREAHRRLQSDPARYRDQVVGEHEIGGTSVIYISDIALDFLAFKPELGEQPLEDRTWSALSKVPPLMLGVTGLMAGVWWVSGRRQRIAAEAARTPSPNRAREPDSGVTQADQLAAAEQQTVRE
jgi:formate dehydrogenase iron-sulfur subunit